MPYSHTSFGILVGPGGCRSLKFLLRFMSWFSLGVVCCLFFYEAPSLDFFSGWGGDENEVWFYPSVFTPPVFFWFFWRWCGRGIELYSKPLLSDFVIYWSFLESYCTVASMFNEPFLTFISKLPPAKSIEQCRPNFTDGAVYCQPMERWKDDIRHWHWVLVICFLFNGFCPVQRVSEKQSTIFHKNAILTKKIEWLTIDHPFFVYTFGHPAACWWKISGDSCSQADTFVVLIGFGVS